MSKDLQEKFNTLVSNWRKETSAISNPNIIWGNKSYQKIIKLGPEILPYIFKNMEDKDGAGHLWSKALSEITGINALEGYKAPTSKQIVETWLIWGESVNLHNNLELERFEIESPELAMALNAVINKLKKTIITGYNKLIENKIEPGLPSLHLSVAVVLAAALEEFPEETIKELKNTGLLKNI